MFSLVMVNSFLQKSKPFRHAGFIPIFLIFIKDSDSSEATAVSLDIILKMTVASMTERQSFIHL
jgi:hypothetical protein